MSQELQEFDRAILCSRLFTSIINDKMIKCAKGKKKDNYEGRLQPNSNNS